MMKKTTKKEGLIKKINLMLITSSIITLLALSMDNIVLKNYESDYKERYYKRLDRENDLGVLDIKDFPKQKRLPNKGLVEINFQEFVEIINDENNYNGYLSGFDADEVTYKEIRNTRFFRKEDLSGIYLTDKDKRLFKSIEVFNKEQGGYLYEIVKEDKIFFYEKINDYYLKIYGFKDSMVEVHYKKESFYESYMKHYESVNKYIKGEIARKDVLFAAPVDNSIEYQVFEYKNKIYKFYKNNINASLDINKERKIIFKKANDVLIFRMFEFEKMRIFFILAIWLITLILISYGIINYLINKNKK